MDEDFMGRRITSSKMWNCFLKLIQSTEYKALMIDYLALHIVVEE